MYDALQALQSLVTSVTSYTSTGVDLRTGTPRRGLKARFRVTNYSGASAGHTWIPTIQVSQDNTTYVTVAQSAPLTTTTSAQTSEVFVPFEFYYPWRYVRAMVQLSGTTGTPTISYSADVGNARPG